MTTIRTNPAYAHLAYRRAILSHTISWLQTNVLGTEGFDPTEQVVSDDVFREDEDVPLEDIQVFVEELQAQEAHLSLEMGRFEFVRKQSVVVGATGGTKRKNTKARAKTRRNRGGV